MSEFYDYGKTNCWYCHKEVPTADIHTEEVGPRHYMGVCPECCTCTPRKTREDSIT